MKTLLIIFLIILCSAIIAQESRGMASKTQQQTEKTDKSQSNVIDYNNPAQKVKPVKLENHEGAIVKQERKTGSALSSGPAEVLEKKDPSESQLTNAQLQQHLKSTKIFATC